MFKKLILIFLLITASLKASDRFDILVSDDRSVSDQLNPRAAIGNNGNWVVLWVDKRNSGGDIYCQYLDSAGDRLGKNFKVNDNDNSIPQFEAAIASSVSGQFMSAWKDYRNGSYPFHPDIYFSRIDSLQIGADCNVSSELPDTSVETPDLAILYDGSAIVVWSDYRNNNWDIYGQKVSAAGELVGRNFKINDEAGIFQQHSPRVTSFSDGGFIVVWYDNRFASDDIFGQRYDASFTKIGSNIKISDDAGLTRQAFPAVSTDASGRFYVAWVDWRNGVYPQNPDIYLRRFKDDGTPSGPAARVSLNDGGRAQKEVSICADRLGNICVVWSDSSNGQWDVVAQMLDENGALLGSSFKVHQLETGRQLQPDVETDGNKFFFVWADSRSGNFDIYATIKQYNNPSLVARPSYLNFTMGEGESIPSLQQIVLTNAGYGALTWSVVSDEGWLSISPNSGTTPDTLQVSIATDTLTFGNYQANIRIINLNGNDSSLQIPVHLNVTAPTIAIMPDSLYFRVFAASGNPSAQALHIGNSSSGSFTWVADENAAWFSIDRDLGVSNDSIFVSVDISGLSFGVYREPIIFTSPEAENSPDTVWVHMELVGDMPFLKIVPETLFFAGQSTDRIEAYLKITNQGTGSLNWNAAVSDGWMELDHLSGSDDDSVLLSLNTIGLSSGVYQSQVLFYDSAAFNLEVVVPVVLTLTSGDTIQFANINILPGTAGVMPISINLSSASKGAYIPFAYDTELVSLDSIAFNSGAFPAFADYYSSILGGGKAELGFKVKSEFYNDSLITAGSYVLAQLYFTADTVPGIGEIDTTRCDSGSVHILDSLNNYRIPAVFAGRIEVGEHTGIDNPPSQALPLEISLGQNFPNPFNQETIIKIRLPRSEEVTLDIFNLLGQRICRLFNGPVRAGEIRLLWDGRLTDGRTAPSGVYFYRLETKDKSLIRKLVLLK